MKMMLIIVVLLTTVHVAAGSECCDSYYDALDNWKDPQWCDNYCCGTAPLKLYCCDDVIFQAPVDYRSDFCGLWWTHHVWAPIVTGVVALSLIICCGICCYRCCCARNRTMVVLQNPAMGGMGGSNINTTIVSSQNSMSSNYNQPVQFDPIKY